MKEPSVTKRAFAAVLKMSITKSWHKVWCVKSPVWVAVVGLLVTCSFQSSESADNQTRTRDFQVMDAILFDLTTYKGQYRPYSLVPTTPRDVYFDPKPYRSRDAQDNDPLKFSKEWDKMSIGERSAVQEATRHIESRGEVRGIFKKYRPQHKRIHLAATRAQPNRKTPYMATFPMQAWVPGYSRDGNIAVVQLYFSEIFHPSIGTYVLQRKERNWKVLYRAFVMFA
jgi:hypothetical protein